MNKIIKLPCHGITVTLASKGGYIESGLQDEDVNVATDEVTPYNAAVSGMESLILACACEGINIKSAKFIRAIETAVDAIKNNI